jgi:hypothetical protein
MRLKLKTRLLGGVLSAIVLGAVGSGVWQYVFDPALSKGSKVILDLATLGVESFKNDLYREIAIGFREKASSALYSQLNILFGLALIGIPIALAIRTKELIQQKSALLEELQRLEEGKNKVLPSIEELRQDIRNARPERLLVAVYALVVVGVVFFSAQFVTSKRDRYVNSAIAHYGQLRRTVSPYVAQNELLLLDSRFSQIQSAKDYESIIFQMSDITKQHNAKVPEFEVWK